MPLYRLIRRYVPAGAAVLDWGAGNGHFSFFLARAGYRATGFGFDGDAFRSWLGDAAYRFVAGSAADPVTIPFEAASFDAVASVGVLEHVRETGGTEAASLREIARVLKPGGVFIAYHFPNRTSWIDWAASRVPGKHHHRYRYGAADIAALVSAAGLEAVARSRYGILPRNSLHRVLGPLADAPAPTAAYDALDATLGAVLAPWCQNWWFVARKPALQS
jgi:SAM-dependent methyltransferase